MFDAHLDRQIVVALFPVLRAQWQLSDVQLGSLVSIVSLMVAACAVPGALLADRAGHARALVAMVVLWNAATLACAAAGSYGTMVGLRALVGVAQAAFGAVSAAMLAALFPPHARGTILGLFLAAGLVGNALGVFVGGVIAARWDWSTAFAAAALPGFALAVLLLALESRAGAGPVARAGAPWLGHLRRLIRTRTLLLLCLGGGFQLLTVAALASWMPAFLYRSHGLDVARAGSAASLVLVVGVLGAVGWGVVCDRLGAARPALRVLIPACLAAATAALATCTFALASPGTLQYALMIATGAVMTGYLGPVAAAVADVAQPAVRATAIAFLALAHNLLGLAAGPMLAGLLSDALDLRTALAVVPAASIAAAALFVMAARSYVSDRDAAALVPSWAGEAPSAPAALHPPATDRRAP